MQHSDLVLNAILAFLSYNHVCFIVIQVSQISSIWM